LTGWRKKSCKKRGGWSREFRPIGTEVRDERIEVRKPRETFASLTREARLFLLFSSK
jgi:hypothetical protein